MRLDKKKRKLEWSPKKIPLLVEASCAIFQMQFPCIHLLRIFGALKTLAIILSLIVTMMSSLPCCLYDNCPGDKEHAEQTTGHEEHQEEAGRCTPFCVCATCSVPLSQISRFEPVWELPFVIESKTRFLILEQRLSPSFFHSFWQPPKLSVSLVRV